MAIRLSYDEGSQILYGVFEQTPTPEDIDGALAAIVGSEEYSADVDILWDARNVDFRALDATVVKRFVGIRRAYSQRSAGRSAILVHHDLGFGMARMYQMLAAGPSDSLNVFRDPDEAVRWLLAPRRPR